jgi:hypothetical protein
MHRASKARIKVLEAWRGYVATARESWALGTISDPGSRQRARVATTPSFPEAAERPCVACQDSGQIWIGCTPYGGLVKVQCSCGAQQNGESRARAIIEMSLSVSVATAMLVTLLLH